MLFFFSLKVPPQDSHQKSLLLSFISLAAFLPGCFLHLLPPVKLPRYSSTLQPTTTPAPSLNGAMLYGPLLLEKEMPVFSYPPFPVKNSHGTFLEDKILHSIMSVTGSALVRLTSEPPVHLNESQKHCLSVPSPFPLSTSFWSREEGKFPLFIS